MGRVVQLPSLPWAAQLFFAKELGRVRELNPPRFARFTRQRAELLRSNQGFERQPVRDHQSRAILLNQILFLEAGK